MKNNVLFLIVFNALALTSCDNHNIKFKDSVVERICIENWDTDEDGKLSFEEAANVTYLDRAFKGEPITEFNELEHFSNLDEIGDEAFSGCEDLASIVIPNNVIRIGEDAFKKCFSLTSINLPSKVSKIDVGAFSFCNQLKTFEVPYLVSTIEECTFYNCFNLSKVRLFDNITKICVAAFMNCKNLSELDLPKNVKLIEFDAFKGCNDLKIVTCHATTPPTLEKDAFKFQEINSWEDNNKLIDIIKIQVPDKEAVNVYKRARGWRDFADKIESYRF